MGRNGVAYTDLLKRHKIAINRAILGRFGHIREAGMNRDKFVYTDRPCKRGSLKSYLLGLYFGTRKYRNLGHI